MAQQKKNRKRGGASVECPRCGSASEVILTRRMSDAVVRWRRCRKMSCRRKFKTEETVLREVG